jgi:hypothetical protein
VHDVAGDIGDEFSLPGAKSFHVENVYVEGGFGRRTDYANGLVKRDRSKAAMEIYFAGGRCLQDLRRKNG